MLQSCKEEQTVTFDISGYCYDTCRGAPLAHYKVEHSKAGSQYQTYTDESGYFKLSGFFTGTGSTFKPLSPGAIEFKDTSGMNACCNYFYVSGNAKFNDDTIYGYNQIKSVISIRTIQRITGPSDTLFMHIHHLQNYDGSIVPTFQSSAANDYIEYHKFYVGPFYQNQILDTISTMLPPHVGYMNNKIACSFRLLGPNGTDEYIWGRYSFVFGQRNTVCGSFHSIQVDIRN